MRKDFIIRVERQSRSMWRTVKRETTARGISGDKVQVIGDNYHRRADADIVADQARNHLRRTLKQPSGVA